MVLVIVGALGLSAMLQKRPGAIYLGKAHAWEKGWLPARDHAYAGNAIRSDPCRLDMYAQVPTSLPDACATARRGASEPTLLVIGDSHAFADWGMAAHGYELGAYRLATLSHDGCKIGDRNGDRPESCRLYWENMPSLAARSTRAGDAVLISISWGMTDPDETSRAVAAIEGIARALRVHGVGVAVEAPTPILPRPGYLCTEEWFRFQYRGCSVDRAAFERRRAPVLDALARAGVRVWDPLPQLCPGAGCAAMAGEKPVFRDTNHLSYVAARTLGPSFVAWLHLRQSADAARDPRSALTTPGPTDPPDVERGVGGQF